MPVERIWAMGLAMPWPAMSGALPPEGSYMPKLPSAKDAEGSMPSEPVSMAASSERMSPNMFSHRMTSNCFGHLTSCMAALSTYMWDSSTSGYSLAMPMTTSRQSTEEERTLALSMEQTFLPRLRAA